MADLRERALEVTTATTDAMLHIMNESSVGLYRIQEHIFKKTPVIVAEKRVNAVQLGQIERARSDVGEAQELVSKMNRVHGFHRSVEKLKGLLHK